MTRLILSFEDPAAAEPEEAAEVNEESSGSDYTQLLYEYIVEQDVFDSERQEEIYAAYTEKLDSINTNLQNIYSVMDWILAMLMFLVVYILFRSVRRWVKTLGGFKDVH